MLILKVRRRLSLNKVIDYFLEIVVIRLFVLIEAIIDFRRSFFLILI